MRRDDGSAGGYAAAQVLAMDTIYLLAMLACLVQTCRTGFWRRAPIFAAATAASIAFDVAYQPYSPAWLRSYYVAAVTPLLAFRALAVAEAFVISSTGQRSRRLIAASSVLLALMFAAVIAWRFAAADVLHSAVQARRVVVVALAAFLGVYVLLMWSIGYRRSGMVDLHVLLMFLLCATMATSSVLRMAKLLDSWQAASDVSYAACALVYLTWALSFSIRELPHVPPPPGIQCLSG